MGLLAEDLARDQRVDQRGRRDADDIDVGVGQWSRRPDEEGDAIPQFDALHARR